jgi:hypothetical protein
MYSGVTEPHLCTISEVMQIAEEAIQSNMNIPVVRSDSVKYCSVGIKVLAWAKKNLNQGWVMNKLLINVECAGSITAPVSSMCQG